MLARIAHELYWIGRQLARAEHTSRMLDGVFHADLQGQGDDPAGVRLSWDALVAIVSGEPPETSASRDGVLRLLTLDPEHPTSVLNCVTRAREGARVVRDVFSGEMWESINTFHLGLLQRNTSAAVQTGPYSVYAYVRERCGMFWGVTGRTMLRDEAHAFLQAGSAIESADMVLRMLRVALPLGGEGAEAHLRDGHALALLQAVGGFQAFRRSVPAPPNAGPVARFLLFERDYPDSVAFSIEALHLALTAADPSYRSSPAVLRLSRMVADLEFRGRAAALDSSLADTLGDLQHELAQVDSDIAQRYFGGPAQPVARPALRMNFAIRYLTEYRYESPVTDNLNALRVKPATMATQSVEDFVVRVDPESRLNQHLDYFGTTVIEFGISRPHEHLSIDVRARVRTSTPDEPPESSWGAVETAAYDAAAGEFQLPVGPEPDDPVLDELIGFTRGDTPLATLRALVEAIPDRFEYRAGVTYVGSTVADLLAAGAGVCQDFAHLALLLLRRHGIGARYVSGYLWAPAEGDDASAEVETHAWIEALLPLAGRADVGRRRSDQPHAGRRVAREDRPRPPLRGRAADQGRLPRRRRLRAERLGEDDARRRAVGRRERGPEWIAATASRPHDLEAAWAEARPACPGHRHPALAQVLDGEAWWTCPAAGTRLGRFGTL